MRGRGRWVRVVETRLEPVHNVLLLVTTETGLLGGMALLTLGAAIAWRAWQRRRTAAAAGKEAAATRLEQHIPQGSAARVTDHLSSETDSRRVGVGRLRDDLAMRRG